MRALKASHGLTVLIGCAPSSTFDGGVLGGPSNECGSVGGASDNDEIA